MASFARSFLGCGGKAGRAGARRPRALSSEVRGGDLSQRKPAPGVHEAGSGCVHKDPYPPLSEAATKLNALLDEIKGKKLNSVPLVMVGKTISNFEIVWREVHFKNIVDHGPLPPFFLVATSLAIVWKRRKPGKRGNL
uniref:Uncharacterized protein n=1 Tax=Oryza glaberrima TaxID=4538 RepID=I1NXJ2_ORYGL